jgi:hypothetical protein
LSFCTYAGDAEPKLETPQKQRYVPAEAPAVSAWGRNSKLLFEQPEVNGNPSKNSSAPHTAPAAPSSQVHAFFLLLLLLIMFHSHADMMIHLRP